MPIRGVIGTTKVRIRILIGTTVVRIASAETNAKENDNGYPHDDRADNPAYQQDCLALSVLTHYCNVLIRALSIHCDGY